MSDLGPVFMAQYDGRCIACDYPIVPGEDIRACDEGYVHADDQCERAVTGEPHRGRPLLPCVECFQVPSVSGSCGCGGIPRDAGPCEPRRWGGDREPAEDPITRRCGTCGADPGELCFDQRRAARFRMNKRHRGR